MQSGEGRFGAMTGREEEAGWREAVDLGAAVAVVTMTTVARTMAAEAEMTGVVSNPRCPTSID
jgi:hypothetical protein